MARPSTLYRFRIELSDVDRSVYRSFDLRIPQHPSENETYLLTRLLAYLLSYEEGLEFAPGLCTDDEPAIFLRDPSSGGFLKWIEIGNPSARRLHKASKASGSVLIYTYKDPVNLVRELQGERVHRLETIQAFALDPKFLERLAALLSRDNAWSIFRQDGELTLGVGDEGFSSPLTPVLLQP
jgi:uncharacterized protein YaeQ